MAFSLKPGLVLALCTLGWTVLGFTQTPPPGPTPSSQSREAAATVDPLPGQSGTSTGTIKGTVVDQSGAVVGQARVQLTGEGHSVSRDARSGDDGQFSFLDIAPGNFRLIISASGFEPQVFSGVLHAGEIETVPQITLTIAETRTEVEVGLRQTEVAEEQIKEEEKQRVLGVIPNFYVSYIPDAAPLSPKQKFKLAWRILVDPFTVVVVGGTAGIEQAQNHFAGYGQGAEGYAKRFGASYADAVAGTVIGSALLPSLLKQDPRYFYKGTGSKPSRFMYAIANALICKGDNGKWQPNYSNILGSMTAGGLSNLYYPKQDRDGAALTFENAGIGIGTSAIANVFQEFIIRKLTPKLPQRNPVTP
jgi:hypothetical protein